MDQPNTNMNQPNTTELIFQCPHCQGDVIIAKSEINCGIFRHAIYKSSGQQIPPHAPKEECDRLITQNEIFGCARPFQIIKNNNETSQSESWQIQICEYI